MKKTLLILPILLVLLLSSCTTIPGSKDAKQKLEELGYTREGKYYRVTGEDTEKTVAMFSHGGASSAALSHMFNIPFPQFCFLPRPRTLPYRQVRNERKESTRFERAQRKRNLA